MYYSINTAYDHHLKIEMQAVENSITLKLLPKLIKSVFEYLMMQLFGYLSVETQKVCPRQINFDYRISCLRNL